MISNWVWILGFYLFLYLDPIADFRQKHIFAFVGISIALFAHFIFNIEFPEHIWTYSALGIVFLIVTLSSQFSGTPRNSGTLYGVLFLIPIIQSIGYIQNGAYAHYAPMGIIAGFTIILILVHSIIYEAKSDFISTINFISVPVLIGLILGIIFIERIGLHPIFSYYLWLMAILYHIEKKVWATQYPIPLLLLIVFLLILAFPQIDNDRFYTNDIINLFPILITVAGISIFIWFILFSKYISKIVFYTVLTSKFLLIYNILQTGLPYQNFEKITFYHTMLSLSLFALTVQLENTKDQSIMIKDIRGLLRTRTRVMMMWFVSFVLVWIHPLSQISESLYGRTINVIYIAIGIIVVFQLIVESYNNIEKDYHIIRPALGIWMASLAVILAYLSEVITHIGWL